MTEIVWLVWSESGEYENHVRELSGIFASQELAEEFAIQLGADSVEVEVKAGNVLRRLPTRATRYRRRSHISEAGQELRYAPWVPGNSLTEEEGADTDEWPTWKYPGDKAILSATVTPWRNSGNDMHIEVEGTDLAIVEREYARLLGEVRSAMSAKREG